MDQLSFFSQKMLGPNLPLKQTPLRTLWKATDNMIAFSVLPKIVCPISITLAMLQPSKIPWLAGLASITSAFRSGIAFSAQKLLFLLPPHCLETQPANIQSIDPYHKPSSETSSTNLIQFPPSAISPPSTTEENRHHSITLNAYDIDLAMKFLMKKSQWVSFPNELKVPQKRNIVATSSRIRPFSLFLDESNIMRAKGRLQKSRLDYCSKHPAILDGKYPATYLLIQKVHISNEHSPREHTRNTLQADYWNLSARSQIRKMYNSCYDCRCQLAYGLQSEISPLPSCRFPSDKPFLFQQTGLFGPLRQTEFFGPFASNNSTTYSKRYGLIFTCMTTRAVHLEMGHDLWSDANLTALRRFFARRGTLSEIRSDNATNFTAAEKELMTTFDSSSMNQFFGYHQLSWKFNPPTHRILVASENVSSVSIKTLYPPSLDLKPSLIILSTPCFATLNSLWIHDPSQMYRLLPVTSRPWLLTISFLEECLPVCLQKLILSH